MSQPTTESANGLQRIRIDVKGITPLLMNRMSEDSLLGLRTKNKKAKSKASDQTPRDEAMAKAYLTKDGAPYWPIENVMSMLISAGQSCRLDGKRQMSTAKSSVIPGFLQLEEAYLQLKTSGMEVDLHQGRNPNGGEAVCIIRPRFDEWSYIVTMTLDTFQVSEAQARELWDIAVSRIGHGDFRPARKGTFGRAVITKWQRL
jgi:hypothetical protein